MSRHPFLFSLTAVFLVCSPASANLTYYTDKATFLAAITNPYTVDFNSTGDSTYLGTGDAFYKGDYLFAGGQASDILLINNHYPGYHVNTDGFLEVQSQLFAVGFPSEVSAIGFDINNNALDPYQYFFAPEDPISLLFFNGAYTQGTLPGNTTSFLGVISTTPLDAFTVLTDAPVVQIDNLTTTPEPRLQLLMTAGFGILAYAIWRRRTGKVRFTA